LNLSTFDDSRSTLHFLQMTDRLLSDMVVQERMVNYLLMWKKFLAEPKVSEDDMPL
jgi:hypothetical protein